MISQEEQEAVEQTFIDAYVGSIKAMFSHIHNEATIYSALIKHAGSGDIDLVVQELLESSVSSEEATLVSLLPPCSHDEYIYDLVASAVLSVPKQYRHTFVKVLHSIFSNVVKNGEDSKFRRLRLDNSKFAHSIARFPSYKALFKFTGWQFSAVRVWEFSHKVHSDNVYSQRFLIVSTLLDQFLAAPEEWFEPGKSPTIHDAEGRNSEVLEIR